MISIVSNHHHNIIYIMDMLHYYLTDTNEHSEYIRIYVHDLNRQSITYIYEYYRERERERVIAFKYNNNCININMNSVLHYFFTIPLYDFF